MNEDTRQQRKAFLEARGEEVIKGIMPSMPFLFCPLMDVPLLTDSEIRADAEFTNLAKGIAMTVAMQHPTSALEMGYIVDEPLGPDAPCFTGDENFMRSVRTCQDWIIGRWADNGRSAKEQCYQNSVLLLGLLAPFATKGYTMRVALGKANFTGRVKGEKVVGRRITHMWALATNSDGDERILDVGDRWYSNHTEESNPSKGQILLKEDLERANGPLTMHEMTEWVGAIGNWATATSLGFDAIQGYILLKMALYQDGVLEKDDNKGGSFYA